MCASFPVECGDGPSGHTPGLGRIDQPQPRRDRRAGDAQRRPRPGLGSGAFNLHNRFAPAGGVSLRICPAGGTGCRPPAGVQDGGDGVYLLWVHPEPVGTNWKAGSYFPRITVTDPAGRKGSALVKITVP